MRFSCPCVRTFHYKWEKMSQWGENGCKECSWLIRLRSICGRTKKKKTFKCAIHTVEELLDLAQIQIQINFYSTFAFLWTFKMGSYNQNVMWTIPTILKMSAFLVRNYEKVFECIRPNQKVHKLFQPWRM